MKPVLLKTVFLALFIVFFAGDVAGQSTVHEIMYLASNNSLVREYNRKVDIIYNDNGTRAFLNVDKGSMNVIEAQIPNLQSVSDMEIVDSVLYFCGVYAGVPVIGRFNINSFFFGGGSVEVVSVAGVVSGRISLNKLEVYFRSNKDVHVFVTASISPSAPGMDYYAVLDAMYDGTGWDIECISDPGGGYVMSDLAITDNRLMVVGEKSGHRGDLFNHYILPTTPTTHLSVSSGVPPIMMHSNASAVYRPLSQPIVEYIGNKEIVTACYGILNSDTGVVITKTDELVSGITFWIFPNVTGSTLLRDLRYEATSKRIYIVPDINSTVVKDYMYVFDMANETAQVYQSALRTVCSVSDNYNKVSVSGITQGGTVGVWQTSLSDCRCDRALDLKVDHASDYDAPGTMNVVVARAIAPKMDISPVIDKYKLGVICR